MFCLIVLQVVKLKNQCLHSNMIHSLLPAAFSILPSMHVGACNINFVVVFHFPGLHDSLNIKINRPNIIRTANSCRGSCKGERVWWFLLNTSYILPSWTKHEISIVSILRNVPCYNGTDCLNRYYHCGYHTFPQCRLYFQLYVLKCLTL